MATISTPHPANNSGNSQVKGYCSAYRRSPDIGASSLAYRDDRGLPGHQRLIPTFDTGVVELSEATAIVATMVKGFAIVAAMFALAGTVIQGLGSLRQLKDLDPDGHRAFVAVDDLNTEFSALRHPARWLQRRREMKQLLAESPEEAALARRFAMQIWGWVSLGLASVFALVVAAIGS